MAQEPTRPKQSSLLPPPRRSASEKESEPPVSNDLKEYKSGLRKWLESLPPGTKLRVELAPRKPEK
jgi:hypothetical protein